MHLNAVYLFLTTLLSLAPLSFTTTYNKLSHSDNDLSLKPENSASTHSTFAPVFIIIAGPPGSGKTTTREYAKKALIHPSDSRKHMVVSVDEIISRCPEYKRDMSVMATQLKNISLTDLPSRDLQIITMEELAAQSDEIYFKYRKETNSDQLCKDWLNWAIHHHHHVYFETTMGSNTSCSYIKDQLIPIAKRRKYKVVIIKPEVALNDLYSRCWERAKGEQDPGRLVKPSVINRVHDYLNSRQPIREFHEEGLVDAVIHYDLSPRRPLLASHWRKKQSFQRPHSSENRL